jgi:hypothetical protein
MGKYNLLVVISLFLSNIASAETAIVVGGQGADPAQLWPQLNGLVEEMAMNHNISMSQAHEFSASIQLSYNHKEKADGELLHQNLSGRLLFPVCSKEKAKKSVAFTVDVRVPVQEMVQAEVIAAVSDTMELALVDYASSCTLNP